MNGIHDMGGMHGLGPVVREQHEPVFHQRWEGRVYGLSRLLRFGGRWNLDAFRYAQEQTPPAEYLRLSYYERWLRQAGSALTLPSPAAAGEGTFKAGQRVVAKRMAPVGHTRLPRYVRGGQGVIDRDLGVFNLPDISAAGGEPQPQHVYSVRFEAAELWGADATPRCAVYVDCWEQYLEPA